MSRLIDADELIEDLTYVIETMIEENEDDDYGGHDKHDEYLEGNINFSEIAKKLIEKQPTAFDVDKVVKQLEDKYGCDSCDFHEEECKHDKHCFIYEMIDMIKAGGIDDKENIKS